MMTYAPNLWKLFLNYATDAVGKIPEINSPFPVAAQLNERGNRIVEFPVIFVNIACRPV